MQVRRTEESSVISEGLNMECLMDHIVLNVEDDEKMKKIFLINMFRTNQEELMTYGLNRITDDKEVL